MINLLANTRSTAFVEAAFRLLEIQEIRNSRVPSQPINIISISADFNENLYSIYAEIPLTIVLNQITDIPELEVEDTLLEYTMEEYGTSDNISEFFVAIASALEIEETTIGDSLYNYGSIIQIESIPIEVIYLSFGVWDGSSINLNIEYFGTPINDIDFNAVFTDTPVDEGFYVDNITGFAVNPKNIESQVDAEKLKIFITATIPFIATIDVNGGLNLKPVDYL